MLSDVKKNIEKLIALYEGERQQKIELAAALEEKEAVLDSCRKHIADLERQVDNLKLKGAFTTDAGNDPAAKEMIERMIREIDKCISLLDN